MQECRPNTAAQRSVFSLAVCGALAVLPLASAPAAAERQVLPNGEEFTISSDNRGDGWTYGAAALDSLTIKNDAPTSDFWDLQSADEASFLLVDKDLTLNGGSLKAGAESIIEINENLKADAGARLHLGKSGELTVYGDVDFTDSDLTLAEGIVFRPYRSDVTFKDSVLTSEGSSIAGASSLTFTGENAAYACTGEDNYLVADEIAVKDGATMTLNTDATLGVFDSSLTFTNASLVNRGNLTIEEADATFDSSVIRFQGKVSLVPDLDHGGQTVADSLDFTGSQSALIIGDDHSGASGGLTVATDMLDLTNTSVVIGNRTSTFSVSSETGTVTFGDLHVAGYLYANTPDDIYDGTMILTGKTVLAGGKLYANQMEAQSSAVLYSTGKSDNIILSASLTDLSPMAVIVQDNAHLSIAPGGGLKLGDVVVGNASSLRIGTGELLSGRISLNGQSADTASTLTCESLHNFTGTIKTDTDKFGTFVAHQLLPSEGIDFDFSQAELIVDGTLTIKPDFPGASTTSDITSSPYAPTIKLGKVDVAGVLDLSQIASFANSADDGHVITLKGAGNDTGVLKLYAPEKSDCATPAFNIRATTAGNEITVVNQYLVADFKNTALEITDGASLALSVTSTPESTPTPNFSFYADIGNTATTNNGELHLSGQNVMFNLGANYAGNGAITFDDATSERLISTDLASFKAGARFDIGSAADPQNNVFAVQWDPNDDQRLCLDDSDRITGSGVLKAPAIELTGTHYANLGLWAEQGLLVNAKDAVIASLDASNARTYLQSGASLTITGAAHFQKLYAANPDLDFTPASSALALSDEENTIGYLLVSSDRTFTMTGRVEAADALIRGTFIAGDGVTIARNLVINSRDMSTLAQAYLPSGAFTATTKVQTGGDAALSIGRGFLFLGSAVSGGASGPAPVQDWNSSLAKLTALPLLADQSFTGIGCLSAYGYDLNGATVVLGTHGNSAEGALTVASDAALIISETSLQQTGERTYSTGFKGNIVNGGAVLLDFDRLTDRTTVSLVADGFTITDEDGAQWLAKNVLYDLARTNNGFFITYDDAVADQYLDTVDATLAQRIKAHAAAGGAFDSTRTDGLGFISKVLKDVVTTRREPPAAPETPANGEADVEPVSLLSLASDFDDDAVAVVDDVAGAPSNTASSGIDSAATADRISRTLSASNRLAVLSGVAQNTQAALSLVTSQIEERSGFRTTTASHVAAATSTAGSLWASPLYNKTRSNGFKAGAYSYGLDTDLYGLALGGDAAVTDGVRLGAAFSGGTGDSDSTGALMKTKNDFDFYSGSLYAVTDIDNVTVLIDLDYTWLKGDVKQANNVTTLKSTVKSDITSLGVSTKRVFETDGGVTVAPYAGVRVNRLHVKGYDVKDEDGGTVIQGDAKTQYYATVPAGMQVSKNFELANGYVKPAFDLGLVTTVGSRNLETRVTYTGFGDVKTSSEVRDRTAFTMKFGVNGEVGNFEFGMGYGFMGSENSTNHQVYGNVRYHF